MSWPRAISPWSSVATTRSPRRMRVSAVHGPLALAHFDTHTDTSAQVFGVKMSHGTIMRRLVEDGHVAPNRYAQVGQRGYWPGEKEFSWQVEHGISHFMHDVRDLSIEAHSLSCEGSPLRDFKSSASVRLTASHPFS